MNPVRKQMRRGVCRDESGAVAIITAICLMVLLGFVALVVDVGHIKAVRNELQNAADASALAGTRALFDVPVQPGELLIPVTGPPNCALGVSRAQNTINQGDTQNLTILTTDIQTGNWNWQTNTFTPSTNCVLETLGVPGVNAVRVTARKDTLANSPLNNWFARIWGIDTTNVIATATASVGYLSSAPGGIIAIDKDWLLQLTGCADTPGSMDWFQCVLNWIKKNSSSTQSLNFYPDKADNGAWAAPVSPSISSVNNSELQTWINSGNLPSVTVGGDVYLQNGLGANLFNLIQKQVNRNGGAWTILVPIVDPGPPSTNNVQSSQVLEVLPVTIIGTTGPAHGTQNDWAINIHFNAQDNLVPGSQPGGPVSNLYATQPKLVGQINMMF